MPTAPFTISRVFDAPRELVFKVHTDPHHLSKWMSPAGFTVIKANLDFRVGGTYHYGLKSADGHEMWGKQTFREIVTPEKIVLVQTFSDKDGGLTRHPMSATWPLHMLATTTFTDIGYGKTQLTVSWAPLDATEEETATFDGARAGMTGGFTGMFGTLETYLTSITNQKKSTVDYPSDRALLFTRIVDATRERLWDAWTDPKQVILWWGPEGFSNTMHSMEVKVGGVWQFTMHGPDGTDYPNRITYIEVTKPSRLVYDHGDANDPQRFHVITDFIEQPDGTTKVVSRMTFKTKEERDETAKYALDGHSSHMRSLDAHLSKQI